jgi:succinate-semialdehyde dehydrogenase / glutarate-semialdehyde dehydrogenase
MILEHIPIGSLYLNGQFSTSINNSNYTVNNPATQQGFYTVANSSLDDLNLAINCAQIAISPWNELSTIDRASYLNKISDLLLKYKYDFAHILHLEQGKNIDEAIAEIAYSASYFTWFAHAAQTNTAHTISSPCVNKRMYTNKYPIGICAAITPFNFPSAMIARKLAPALAAGCPMIIKPASETPLSALVFGIIANEVNLPAGLLSILPADNKNTPILGDAICANTDIKKLSFTGSTSVGKLLMSKSADNIKRLSLELGGNAPFIVTKNANVDEAVQGAFINKFRNNGQTCISTNRFFIHADVITEFTKKLCKKIKDIQNDVNYTPSPLININALNKVDSLVKSAIEQGANVLLGGSIVKGLCYAPTVLANVHNDMLISQTEVFGPVASIIEYTDNLDAVRQANNTPYGLAAYVYSENIREINMFSQNLEFGMLGLNNATFSSSAFPFGGVKQSGFGKEGSIYGIDEYLVTRAFCLSL